MIFLFWVTVLCAALLSCAHLAQWYFGMKLLKKFQHIILTLPRLIYRHQMKIIERVRSILHDLALIYTLCYVPKISESKG